MRWPVPYLELLRLAFRFTGSVPVDAVAVPVDAVDPRRLAKSGEG